MPHKNAIAKLKSLGPLAQRLDTLTDEVYDAQGDRKRWEIKLQKLVKFFQANDLRPLIKELSRDRYAYNRELAAIALVQLWTGWKILPYDENRRADYDESIRAYCAQLNWTMPLMLGLCRDRRSGPAELAIRAASEMDYAGPQIIQKYRQALLDAGRSQFSDVRLAVVRHLVDLYPQEPGDSALRVLETEAMDFMIASTRDKDIHIRDWACFELWLGVAKLGDDAKQAFADAIHREDPESEVYMEAIVGLARLGADSEVEDIICQRLAQGDFGKGWVDAARESRSPKCLEALVSARKHLLRDDPTDDRIDEIEDAFEQWNDD